MKNAENGNYYEATNDLEGEIWSSIEGYDYYLVSNKGRVKSLKYLGHKGVERILKPCVDGKGYLRIGLTKDGKKATMKVHRLVATAFIPKSYGKTEVNHIDGNKTNNAVENLEWCTTHENIQHAYNSGLKENNRSFAQKLGSTAGKEALRKYLDEVHSVPVVAKDMKTGEEIRFDSQVDAAKALGLYQANICKVLSGKRKSTGGYSFVKAR